MARLPLPAGFERLQHLDPGLADRLGDDFQRLAGASTALAWALGKLEALAAASSERALLELVVDLARERTGAPRIWALSWHGDLSTGRASYAAMAGDDATIESPPALSRTILGQVVARGRPAWTDDAAQDARFPERPRVSRRPACVPSAASRWVSAACSGWRIPRTPGASPPTHASG
ncbi:MAG: GAF domain-containing protein [Oligoflexia bacterium]|nr:GAF domain-containing protein [Oligoflexia bacterium]